MIISSELSPFIFKRNIALRRPFYDKAIFLGLPKGNNFEQVCQRKSYAALCWWIFRSVGYVHEYCAACAGFYRIGIVTCNDDRSYSLSSR